MCWQGLAIEYADVPLVGNNTSTYIHTTNVDLTY